MRTAIARTFDTSPLILSPFEEERKAAILQSSPGFRLRTASPRQVDPTGDRAFIRLHPISARQEGEL
jgi:hypothetical protein